MQARSAKPPVGALYDGAIGESIDALLGLAVLYGLRANNEVRIASLSVSGSDARAASLCDAIARYYVPSARAAVPVGMSAPGKENAGSTALPMADAVLGKRTADGKVRYTRVVEKWKDTADVAALIRNAMSSQQPENCAVVLAGPATNLALALALPDTSTYIEKRVRALVIAASEADIKKDVAAARRVFAEWPGPIVVPGPDVAALTFPGATLEQRFAATPDHPIAEAYRAFRSMPYDAPLMAGAAALHVIRPQSELFTLSETGTISVLNDGRLQFASGTGKHRLLHIASGQTEAAIKTLADLAPRHP